MPQVHGGNQTGEATEHSVGRQTGRQVSLTPERASEPERRKSWPTSVIEAFVVELRSGVAARWLHGAAFPEAAPSALPSCMAPDSSHDARQDEDGLGLAEETDIKRASYMSPRVVVRVDHETWEHVSSNVIVSEEYREMVMGSGVS